MKTTTPTQAGLLKSAKRYPGLESLIHVAYYHAARVGYQDVISRSLHDFKDGCEPQTSRWISLATPLVCKQLNFDLIVRPLGSAEETVSGSAPLDRLCRAIATASGATYAPERLRKTGPVRALTTLGGRVMRQMELDGAYAFDAAGLPDTFRVLVVDDLVTTGATLEAVCRTIRGARPGARILTFVLARVEAQVQNAHLDQNYFLHGATATKGHPETSVMGTAKAPRSVTESSRSLLSVMPTSRGPASAVRPSVRHDSAGSSDDLSGFMRMTKSTAAPPPEQKMAILPSGPARPRINSPVDARAKAAIPSLRKRKGLDTRVYVVGLVLSLLLLGATFLIPTKKEPQAQPAQFVQLVTENAIRSQDPLPERRPAVAPATEGKPGVVTVPSTGLRASHSIQSKVIPKTTVRNRERVEIVRKFTSQTGPDWILVKTRSGVLGWVMSSVVKEVRG